jgi:hypothetical protein
VLKYLRIAVTALCLTACVLLVALWMRSYSRFDANRGMFSAMGRVYINGATINLEPEDLLTEPEVQVYQTRFGTSVLAVLGGRVKISMARPDAVLPYWALTLLAAILATVPWLPWSKRFSLRALLIATTLVAVGLGMIIYLSG